MVTPRASVRGQDGKPTDGRDERDVGVAEDSAQERFTDTASRIMKLAPTAATTPIPP